MKLVPYAACIMFTLTMVACSEQPKIMGYFPNVDNDEKQYKVWPPPPEVPRYRYAGQLQGEQNFSVDERIKSSTGEKFIKWLVGLTQKNKRLIQLNRPQNGIVGGDGRIYVTDVGNQAVFVFDETAGKLQVWDTADKNSNFISPIGITINKENEILVTDSQLGRVVKLDTSGNPLGSIGSDTLSRPTGIDVDNETGNIYVVDTGEHNIKVFNQAGILIKTIGERGNDYGQFNAPTYLSIHNKKLYVSDTLNARVQILTMEGKPVSSIGQRGLYIGNFTRPKGITLDSEGNIYVVESYYDHVLIFNEAGDFLLPIGGTGIDIGNFFLPSGIWSDKLDRIYTADMLNGRVIIMQYLGE